eukprot:gnl/TRDRNA2_/TRDRNA2_88420_c0_seq1.p1 gnl/TRDRNA2_/TRDRNA2_88420_c0~~gnl/TRDRNA2_/TRDRNA2_88420_c0_seq1.p1  ORF type:complete len:388 (-),score=24.54 gnl/TRDRNA2_/TRDRNA2_88420_c0_seq1:41-1153(-)
MPPPGYLQYSPCIVQHIDSGILTWCSPIDPLSGVTSKESCVLLFHYTTEDSFWNICGKSRQLWATLVDTCMNPYDSCFGDGVYATHMAPHDFGSKELVLFNNYGGVWPGLMDRADCCVPILTPRSRTWDVQNESVPGLRMVWNTRHGRSPQKEDPREDIGDIAHLPGFNRHGKRIDNEQVFDKLQAHRDIWVVGIALGAVHLSDPMRWRLEHEDFAVRVAALEELSNALQPNTKSVLDTMMCCLGDNSEEVRKVALESIAKIAEPGDIPAVDAIARLVQDTSVTVRTAAVNAMFKVAMVGCAQAIEALLKCLNDSKWGVRKRALEALAQIAIPGDLKVVAEVERLIDDDHPLVSEHAEEALATLCPTDSR